MAPLWMLPDVLRADQHKHAVQLVSELGDCVEFLIDSELRPYFIEVNLRIQVEHVVTESISPRGVANQCRVTTKNPEREFSSDTGTLICYRHSAGNVTEWVTQSSPFHHSH